MVAVTVQTREMELTIQRLQGELRHARLENESIKCSLNRTIEGLRVELMRGRHMLSHLRRKLVMGDLVNLDIRYYPGGGVDWGPVTSARATSLQLVQ
ncbi:hypothetical protein AB1Y20_015877 [Prymnesium parvum]|uniref:Uncharacterized protein n=1 Tax=Prymnesium parvum TaxID=97485 RepID=A0AB34K209_PRYPA